MPNHNYTPLVGHVVDVAIDSEAIANNLYGDPTTRRVGVYLPPGYDESNEDYPLLVDLVGFTGSGYAHLGWKCYGETVPQRIERLIRSGEMGPVIAAFPDCFTAIGGNQYINSKSTGNWADFLLDEMIPGLESRFRVRPGPAHRAVFGKSSGGYGAIVHGLKYGKRWGAIACHSGDMAFDLCYLPWFPKLLRMLTEHGGVEGFMAHLAEAPSATDELLHTVMTLAMAATYDPDVDAPAGVRLPVDPHTCALDEAAWSRWLAWDPVHMIEDPACQENLRSLRGCFVDCGDKDQYDLVYGARQLAARLTHHGIPHRYEEFDGTHSLIDYRMDVSLPFLYRALTD